MKVGEQRHIQVMSLLAKSGTTSPVSLTERNMYVDMSYYHTTLCPHGNTLPLLHALLDSGADLVLIQSFLL